jgi:hypothetical protein
MRYSGSRHYLPPDIDLTGHWIGHYEQRAQKRPISADLVQHGMELKGSMKDGEPDRDFTLFELAVEAGLPPGADEQIYANLRAMVPDAPAGVIRYISRLSPDSRLEGRCEGRTVSFVKTYLGPSFSGYRVGDKLLGEPREGHSVSYEGRLSADSTQIEGLWWIEPSAGQAGRRDEGSLSLRREARAESPAQERSPAP